VAQRGENQVGFLPVIDPTPKRPEYLGDDDSFPVIKMRT